MKFTYYGHACFAVEAGGKTLLFDPFITPNPLAKKIDVEKIAADFILISHGHGDHVADVIEIAKRTEAKLITPFEAGEWFEKKGVKDVQAMNHGGAAKTDFGRVKLTAAVHSSSMPDGRKVGSPGTQSVLGGRCTIEAPAPRNGMTRPSRRPSQMSPKGGSIGIVQTQPEPRPCSSSVPPTCSKRGLSPRLSEP